MKTQRKKHDKDRFRETKTMFPLVPILTLVPSMSRNHNFEISVSFKITVVALVFFLVIILEAVMERNADVSFILRKMKIY